MIVEEDNEFTPQNLFSLILKKNFLKFVTLLYYATNPGIIRNSINEITSFK